MNFLESMIRPIAAQQFNFHLDVAVDENLKYAYNTSNLHRAKAWKVINSSCCRFQILIVVHIVKRLLVMHDLLGLLSTLLVMYDPLT